MERLPENLIFDLGGVLIDLDVGRMLKGFEGVGLDPRMFMAESAEKGATTVCEGMSVGQLLSDYQTGDITTEELLETILPECRPGTTREQLVEAWNHCLVSIPRERLETVRRWREKGHRTYMLSNTNDLHWRYISTRCFGGEGLGLEDCFDGVFLSHEMRLAKPDAEIYSWNTWRFFGISFPKAGRQGGGLLVCGRRAGECGSGTQGRPSGRVARREKRGSHGDDATENVSQKDKMRS